nr:PREDICTED: vasotocin-neurophysin VT-like [Lepisosteus oculatus]
MPESALPLCLLGLLALSSACYIQNCPRGGKRSYPDTGLRQGCWPPGLKKVFFTSAGKTRVRANACLEENYLPSPCEAGGRACGAEGGRCAAPGVCCDEESCSLDPSCLEDSSKRRAPADQNRALVDSAAGDLLLRLMHLAHRQAQGAGQTPQY